MRNNFILILTVLFLISFISASFTITPTEFNINKTYNQDKVFSFNITNNHQEKFYNITVTDNDFFNFKIPTIASGETITKEVVITHNEDVLNNLTLYGYYESFIGEGDDVYNVDIDYNNGFSLCDFQAIQGDTIIFKNNVNDPINLINYETNTLITTIEKQGNYSLILANSNDLTYYATRSGFTFTDNCKVDVLAGQGLVRNSDYDKQIKFNLNVEYPATTVQEAFLDTNFSMKFFETQQGIFQLKNTGSNIAKNIGLSDSMMWINFNTNYFDLNPGESRTISYEINPEIYSTNETNKNYPIELLIQGNFPTITQNLNVFIEYSEISYNDINSSDGFLSYLEDYYEEYCTKFPDTSICESTTKVIYKYPNETDNSFNVTMSEQQQKEWFKDWFSFKDDFNIQMKTLLETSSKNTESLNTTDDALSEIKQRLASLEKDKDESSDTLIIMVATIIFVLTIGGLGFIIYKLYLRRKEMVLGEY